MDTLATIGRPARILLVEDNRGDIILAQRAFQECGLKSVISVATTGEDALAMLMLRKAATFFSDTLPDIILLDLNLPKMKGQDVLDAIKKHPDLRHIPVVVLSSSSFGKDVMSSYQLHANGYITKPANLDAYKDTVHSFGAFWFAQAVLPDNAPATAPA